MCAYSLSYLTCNRHAPHYIVVCDLSGSTILSYFSTLSHERYDSRKKKVIEHKMCVFIFSITFVWNFSQDKNNSVRYYIIISVHNTSCNWITHYFCKILVKLNFLKRFSKNAQISNFVKITAMGAELFQANRQTDRWTNMTRLIIALAVLRVHLKRVYYFGRLYEH